MKLKSDLVLRQVADTWIVLALARDVLSFDGIVRLNESGAMLWNILKETEDKQAMVDALVKEFNVDEQEASADVDAFVNTLINAGCIED